MQEYSGVASLGVFIINQLIGVSEWENKGKTQWFVAYFWFHFLFVLVLYSYFCFKSGSEVCEDQTVWPELCLSKLISTGLMSRLHASNQRQFWINYL